MGCKVQDNVEFTKSVCDKLQPFLDPLAQLFGVQTFGYRKFFPDGTSAGISSNFFLTNFLIEKFNHKIIPSYENEVSLLLNKEKCYFFRIGKPDKDNVFLSTLYDLDIWNTLSYYRQSGDCVEGFYYASNKSNENIVEQYFNSLHVFEMFSFYFKEKLSDTLDSEDIDRIRTETISPLVFQKKYSHVSQDSQDIKNFMTNIPVQKFYLSSKGKDYCLSIQEFKCLSFLSRGKTSKEVGLLLNISSRTVESYIENLKNKINIGSRSQLIDLFISNFKNDKSFMFSHDELVKEKE